jgi:hypothetical protein
MLDPDQMNTDPKHTERYSIILAISIQIFHIKHIKLLSSLLQPRWRRLCIQEGGFESKYRRTLPERTYQKELRGVRQQLQLNK